MRRLADRLAIVVPEDRWPAFVEAASFGRMRERADELVPNSTDALWKENRRFFHGGGAAGGASSSGRKPAGATRSASPRSPGPAHARRVGWRA